eukprot:TRINITY_DN5421_c0_g1_i1.p1 TRINITY_DN5421_c0_g1~~TRINITY_DN5421_c0_g1_i1.p1  ORF type:complete len:155 (+),score=7.45 TRINITY_DN5421_c0_g1_i1:79-543(+)
MDAGDMELPDQILEGLYLGDEDQACNIDLLRRHVLSVQLKSETRVAPPSNFVHKLVEVKDETHASIECYFSECAEFISSARRNGKVLVHCYAGISRSPTIIISYLMATSKLTLDCAHDMVRRARPFIWPNAGFRKQLEHFEQTIFAQRRTVYCK